MLCHIFSVYCTFIKSSYFVYLLKKLQSTDYTHNYYNGYVMNVLDQRLCWYQDLLQKQSVFTFKLESQLNCIEKRTFSCRLRKPLHFLRPKINSFVRFKLSRPKINILQNRLKVWKLISDACNANDDGQILEISFENEKVMRIHTSFASVLNVYKILQKAWAGSSTFLQQQVCVVSLKNKIDCQ